MLIFAYTAIVGLVASGIVGSAWTMARDEPMTGWDLFTGGMFRPICALLVVIHTPLRLIRLGTEMTLDGMAAGLVVLAAGIGWSFLQGVFILTQFFGVT
jgi:hypothetical protein